MKKILEVEAHFGGGQDEMQVALRFASVYYGAARAFSFGHLALSARAPRNEGQESSLSVLAAKFEDTRKGLYFPIDTISIPPEH